MAIFSEKLSDLCSKVPINKQLHGLLLDLHSITRIDAPFDIDSQRLESMKIKSTDLHQYRL